MRALCIQDQFSTRAVVICTADALEYPYMYIRERCTYYMYTYPLIGTSVSETIRGSVAISDNARVHTDTSKGYARFWVYMKLNAPFSRTHCDTIITIRHLRQLPELTGSEDRMDGR